jgi:salicylate 5-hydroxylase large subunit
LCPYHQWNYSLKGDLQGVPFRRGVKQDGKVNGGMPKEFKLEEHGLTKLKVATTTEPDAFKIVDICITFCPG